ncbi:Ig-like domain-containing protein [Thermophilibacter sp.]
MSQTINGKHLANRPMTRSPRPRPRRPRRTGLLLGALAAVVAAIIAIPALVALAAPDPVSVEVTMAEPTVNDFYGSKVYQDGVDVTVRVTTEADVTFDSANSTVSASSGALSTGTWNSGTADPGTGKTTYSYTATLTSGTSVSLLIKIGYQDGQNGADASTATYVYGDAAAFGEPSAQVIQGSKPITVDTESPTISIAMSTARIGQDNGVDYYAEGLTATVTVEDASFDATSSKVNERSVKWTRNNDGSFTSEAISCDSISSINVSASDLTGHNATAAYGPSTTKDRNGVAVGGTSFAIERAAGAPTITFEISGDNPHDGNYFTDNVTVTATVKMARFGVVTGLDGWSDDVSPDDSNTHVYTKDFSIAKGNEGPTTISVGARNKGIFSEQKSNSITFTIDNKAPAINVSFDKTNAVPGSEGYYNGAREATITVDEPYGFDGSKIQVLVNDELQSLTWSQDNPHVATIPFDEDDTYVLSVGGEDLSGNKAETQTFGPFTVDTKEPEISFEYDNNAAYNEKYFDAARTPTVVVKDASFDPNETSVTLTRNGEPVDLGTVSWIPRDSDGAQTLSLPACTTSGTYRINVSATDKAKHKVTTSDEFVIDLANPKIEVAWSGSGVEGETSCYNGERVATITVTDDNVNLARDFSITADGATISQWDRDTKTATVTFSNDGDYSLEVKGSDLSGRPSNTVTAEFTIDKTAPVLDVTFADSDNATARDEAGTDYYAAERTATITVTEHNFNPDRVVINTGNSAAQLGDWNTGDGDMHTRTVTFPESADSYDLKVSATDRANNPAESDYDSGTFVVDTTPAEVSIQLNKAQVQDVNGVDYFAEAPTATVTVRDANFKSADSNIVSSGTWSGTWTEGDTDDSGITTWTTTVSFAEGTNQSLSVTAADWAKHTTETPYGTNTTDSEGKELTQSTFTVDLTAPEVTSASVDRNPVNNYGDNYYFNAATTLTVNVSDNIGLDSLTMTDTDDGTYVLGNQIEAGAKTGTVTIGFADGHDFDRAVTVRTTDLAHNYRYWSIAPDGTVSAVNYADPSNEPVFDGTYPESMLQDTVAPVVSLSGVEAGAYYNSPQSVLLSVDELNMPILRTYEPDQVVLTVAQVAGNASGATSTWTRPLSQLAGTGGINYQLTEPFSADGHYTVSAQVTDPARNQDSAQIGEFTIDQTAPTVEVSFDNNDVLNGKYYKAGRTATITVTEHNFDPSLVSIDTNGAVGSWSNNGDTHTIQVSFSTDGVYNLSVSGTDRAGNAMAPYQADEFVVDLTAPTVTISGVEDSTAYKGVVEPTISFADEANFDPNGTTYTLTGTKNGTVTYDASTSAEAQGSTVSYADFAREADVDDIYTLTAHLSDLAGNEADATVTFSVNRFGSTFRVVDAGSYEENDGYLTERRDVVIEEINVSGVASESHDVTVTEGTTVSDLTLNDTAQDTGYTIESGTSTDADSNGWSVYTYRVAAGNFVNDGRYHVAVESVDRADNTNTSSSYYDRSSGEVAAAEVDFILDTTDPVITNLNVQSGQTYDSSAYQGSFTVVENIGLRDVEVLVDGEKVEATDDGYGNYTFEVNAASFTPRDLQITATDLAGRRGTADAEGFHVTTDILELHLPWVIAGAIVVVAAAAGAFYVLVYKPRKDQDQGSNTDAAA